MTTRLGSSGGGGTGDGSMRGSAAVRPLDDLIPEPKEGLVVDIRLNVPAFLAKLASWVDYHPSLTTDASASLVQACVSAAITITAEYLREMATIAPHQAADHIFQERVQSLRDEVSALETKFALTTAAEMDAVVHHAERVVAGLGPWVQMTAATLRMLDVQSHVKNAINGVIRLMGDAFGVLGAFVTTRARGLAMLPPVAALPSGAPQTGDGEGEGEGVRVDRSNMFHALLEDVRTFTNVDSDTPTYLAACQHVIVAGYLQLVILECRWTRDQDDAPTLTARKEWLRSRLATSYTSSDVRILGPRFKALRDKMPAQADDDTDERELVMAGLDSTTAWRASLPIAPPPPPPLPSALPILSGEPPPTGTVTTASVGRRQRARSPPPSQAPASKRGRSSPSSTSDGKGGKGGKGGKSSKYQPLLKLWYLINRSMADDPRDVNAPRMLYSQACKVVQNLYGKRYDIWRHRIDNLQNYMVEYSCGCGDVKQHPQTCDMIITAKGVQAAEALPSFAELMRCAYDCPDASVRDVLEALQESADDAENDEVKRALERIDVDRVEEVLLDEEGEDGGERGEDEEDDVEEDEERDEDEGASGGDDED